METIPTSNNKKELLTMIKKLDKADQLIMFKRYLKVLEISTFTNDGVFFDINDLPHCCFWSIYEFTKANIKKDKTEETNTLPDKVNGHIIPSNENKKAVKPKPFTDAYIYSHK